MDSKYTLWYQQGRITGNYRADEEVDQSIRMDGAHVRGNTVHDYITHT